MRTIQSIERAGDLEGDEIAADDPQRDECGDNRHEAPRRAAIGWRARAGRPWNTRAANSSARLMAGSPNASPAMNSPCGLYWVNSDRLAISSACRLGMTTANWAK